jgi:endonuclease/exonuclease/phosphatase (EEP) superfamily protein YafD
MEEAPETRQETPPVRRPARMPALGSTARLLVVSVLVAGTLVGLAATLAGFFARQAWWLELFTHFRVQLALALGVCSVGLALLRQPVWATAAGAGAVFNTLLVMPLFLGGRPPEAYNAKGVKVIMANVRRQNTDHGAVLSLVNDESPDIVVLTEVDDTWLAGLAPLTPGWPHQSLSPRPDDFGLAVLSRYPLAETHVQPLGAGGNPAVKTRLDVPGAPFTLVAGHPPPPTSGANAAERNRQLEALARLARDQTGPVALCADLNVTNWSPYFGDVLSLGRLVDGRRGFGIQPTWSPGLPRLFALPVDHCLTTADLAVRSVRFGPSIGSDHRPLLVDLAVPPASPLQPNPPPAP